MVCEQMFVYVKKKPSRLLPRTREYAFFIFSALYEQMFMIRKRELENLNLSRRKNELFNKSNPYKGMIGVMDVTYSELAEHMRRMHLGEVRSEDLCRAVRGHVGRKYDNIRERIARLFLIWLTSKETRSDAAARVIRAEEVERLFARRKSLNRVKR